MTGTKVSNCFRSIVLEKLTSLSLRAIASIHILQIRKLKLKNFRWPINFENLT